MKVAALDLGSNTFLLLIAEVEQHKVTKVYLDETQVVRLGQGVNTSRQFHPEALDRAESCFKDFSRLIKDHQVDKVVAVATSAARDVENGAEFLKLGERYGIPIQIISGEQEAWLTFNGALGDRSDYGQIAVIDVGGGSTEVIVGGSADQIKERSVDVGSVRLTEMFVSAQPITPAELQSMSAYAKGQFSIIQDDLHGLDEVIAVAGTPTTMACVIEGRDFSEAWVNGFVLDQQTLRLWIEKMATMSVEERQSLKGMPAKRADVIVTGASILLAAMEALGHNNVTVSTRGVRYGAAMYADQLG